MSRDPLGQCDLHYETQKELNALTLRVALAEQAAVTAQKEMTNMQTQMDALAAAVSAQTVVLNKIGWLGGLAAGALGLLVTFHDHIVKLLGI